LKIVWPEKTNNLQANLACSHHIQTTCSNSWRLYYIRAAATLTVDCDTKVKGLCIVYPLHITVNWKQFKGHPSAASMVPG
jgi:hypothetical protein